MDKNNTELEEGTILITILYYNGLFRYPGDFKYLLYVEDKTGSSVAMSGARIKLTDGETTRNINVPKNGPHELHFISEIPR